MSKHKKYAKEFIRRKKGLQSSMPNVSMEQLEAHMKEDMSKKKPQSSKIGFRKGTQKRPK